MKKTDINYVLSPISRHQVLQLDLGLDSELNLIANQESTPISVFIPSHAPSALRCPTNNRIEAEITFRGFLINVYL